MTEHSKPKILKGGTFATADIPIIKTALLHYATTLKESDDNLKKIANLLHRLGRID